jgi:hypothetical protein
MGVRHFAGIFILSHFIDIHFRDMPIHSALPRLRGPPQSARAINREPKGRCRQHLDAGKTNLVYFDRTREAGQMPTKSRGDQWFQSHHTAIPHLQII